LEPRRTEHKRAKANTYEVAEGNSQDNDDSDSDGESETDHEENLPELQRRGSLPRRGSIMETSDSDDDSSEEDNSEAERIQEPKTLASSAATEAEQRIAKLGKQPDGSKPVQVPKRVWRPKVKFGYEEPEDLLDMSDASDWMLEDKGKVIAEPTNELPPRDDVIRYDEAAHGKEVDKNIQWGDCPEWCQPIVRKIIEEFFNVFAQEGMQRAIRGFEFHIDTGPVKPITCKVPVYGEYEERVIQELVRTLQDKG
jgi:hypothetical protein